MTSSVKQEKHLDAVAIVGIASELPSGEHSTSNLDHEEFFRLLLARKETYEKLPADRFDAERWTGDGPDQIKVDTGSFLKNLADFDHAEFGVTSKDARAMAVSTRKLLHLSFLSFLDSGIDYRAQYVGSFMSAVDYSVLDSNETRGSYAGIPCMVANKVSYHLDLLGPSVPVNTACSSSMTALHLGIQSLRSGECSAVLVGGCQVNHRLIEWINYSQGSILAPDGKCKPFDAFADGFSRGEGAAVIVIKTLEDAIRDKDHIYATILGTGINSCGLGGPVSAPVAEAQKNAMFQAYRGTGRHPSEVDYVEMHTTGTAIGDPTEANWIGESFQRDSEILVGSVKGNIGHLEITAFLASLVKVCSMFTTGLIPPNVNLRTLNPKIKWDEYRLRAVTEVTHLGARHESGRALVSIASSGIGGSNGHAVLEAPPERTVLPLVSEKRPVLLTAGSLSLRSILALCDNVSNNVPDKCYEDLAALATISGRRTRQMKWRSIAIVAPEDASAPDFSFPVLAPRNSAPLAFVFAGQGPQYLEMGRELFKNYVAFRESVLSSDAVYKTELGVSLIESTGLFVANRNAPELPSTWPISIILPAMAMLQVALMDLFRSIGIFPDITIGHSAGETAMLYAANAASKELVIALAIARGRAMSAVEVAAKAGMAALSCSPSKAMDIIVDVTDGAIEGLDIACYNTPEAVTIAGRNELVDLAIQSAEKQGILARRLRTNVAVHSYPMDVCQTQYRELVGDVFARYGPVTGPANTVYSTKTGRIWCDTFTADYYWRSARGPVHFGDAVSELLKDHPNATFVEISPHPVLSSYLRDMSSDNTVLCPMERPRRHVQYHETTSFLSTVGQLLLKGYNQIDFASLNGFSVVPRKKFDCLRYPFSKKQVPYLPEPGQLERRLADKSPSGVRPKVFKVNSQTYPDLAQHVIKGEPIMPATGFIEMSLSQGAREIHNVQFLSMLPLSSHEPLSVKLETDENHWSIVSNETSGNKGRKVHAEGYYSISKQSQETPKALDILSIVGRCAKIDTKDFYDELLYFADYGPLFQRVIDCYKGEDEAIARVRGLDQDLQETMGKYVVHPAILDACLHLGVHRIFTGNTNDQVYYLPAAAESVIVYDALISKGMPEELFVHILLKSWKPDSMSFDCTIVDNKGTHLCQISGLSLLKHRSAKKTAIDHCYDIKNERLPIEAMNGDVVNASPLGPKDIIIHYVQGGEMQMKAKLLPINRYDKVDIWILASDDTNGASARGLTRSLRREIPSWNIRLVLFPTETPVEYRSLVLPFIKARAPSEDEVVVDGNGYLSVPRIVECTASAQLLEGSSKTLQLDAEKAYVLLGGIGSLGLPVALWMYQHGARHLILTSRSGLESKALQHTLTKRILTYLQGLPDVSIRTEKCNVSSVEDMKTLFHTIEQPIGGCMLLATALSDKTFFAQTTESFSMPFTTKTQAFMALNDAIDISALDFLVSFSTASIFGNFGQSNYASANTALDEMIRTVPNAFSMIIPLILDSSIAVGSTGKFSHFLSWAISSEDLFDYLEDALLRFRKEKFWLYIPDINWNEVKKYLGPSSLYDHLTVTDQEGNKSLKKSVDEDRPNMIRDIIMKYMDVDPEDFFPSVPLSSYGLDSLTAAQLSSDLEPFLSVSQVQLLAGISLDEILKRAEEESGVVAADESNNRGGKFSWSELSRAGETLVKLREGQEVPLIIIHGSSGDILPFKPLQDLFTTPLWAIQLTPDAPTQSLPELAKFYYEAIKKARPEGPYRLAGYSGTSAVTYEVAHLIESNGDELMQFVLIDHFPTLFHSPWTRMDEETARSGKPSRALVTQIITAISELYRRDKNPACKRIASELSDALLGGTVSPHINQIISATETIIAIAAEFFLDLAGGEIAKIPEAIRTWVRQIKAPVMLFIASEGNIRCFPESEQVGWRDFRATQWLDNVDVRTINDSHFGMLGDVELARGLEKDW